MDFSQVSGPLMTPPISPAALVHRGSVINQGPMAGRPLMSSSSSSTCSSSSSSCLSSLSAMTQPNPCSSYPETLYHCLPQTSSSYFPPASGSSTPNYQPALRSGDRFTIILCPYCLFIEEIKPDFVGAAYLWYGGVKNLFAQNMGCSTFMLKNTHTIFYLFIFIHAIIFIY